VRKRLNKEVYTLNSKYYKLALEFVKECARHVEVIAKTCVYPELLFDVADKYK
jgi:hypothetical protein